jgi:hypothetical protein
MLTTRVWVRVLAVLGAAVVVASCQSASEAPVRLLAIYPDSITLKANRLVQLIAEVTDASGAQVTGVSVTFTSRDPAVATTTAGGLVTAVAPGSTIIAAEAGSSRDSIPITVTAGGPVTLTLLEDSLVMAIGGTAATTALVVQDGQVVGDAPISYVPSDTGVCSISATGVVTGKASGLGWAVAMLGASRDSVLVVVYRPFVGSLQNPIILPPGGAWGINISSAGVMYVTQQSGNTLTRFLLPSYASAGQVTVSGSPLDVVFSSSGQRAYTVSGASNSFDIVNVAAGTASAYPVGETPWRVRLSWDQATLYVTGAQATTSDA